MKVARRYLTIDLSSYFWWADPCRELCWCDGTTVAFCEEITALLRRLEEGDRFADFSSVALALAVTRRSWPQIAERLTLAVQFLRGSSHPAVQAAAGKRRQVIDYWENTCRSLQLLSLATAENDLSPEERTELLAIVLARRDTGYSIFDRQQIVIALSEGLPDDWAPQAAWNSVRREEDVTFTSLMLPESRADAFPYSTYPSDVLGQATLRILRLVRIANALAEAVPGNTVAELVALVRTGIPDSGSIQPAALQVSSTTAKSDVRTLLSDLSRDAELGGLARLAQQLIAGISLPRRVSEPDSLQLGGVSDIASRGDLDKLLLSELAYDDLTLSVRLALNEALYLRRESPPSPHPSTRCVLIDASLPMWGIPRLYATATALALHATSARETTIRCFRSSQQETVEAALTSVEGITSHMTLLDTAAHPAGSLKAFFQQVRADAAAAVPVMITTSTVLEFADFRQQLDAQWQDELWLIVVDRDGQLQILYRTRQGTSLNRRIVLSLQEILSEPTAKSVVRSDILPDLPAAVRIKPFPLLLPHPVRSGRVWHWHRNVVSLSDDGRLMFWMAPNRGARELARELPVAANDKCMLIERWSTSFALLVCRSQKPATLIQVELRTLHVRITQVEHQLEQVTDICRADGGLLLFGLNADNAPACSVIEYPDGTFGDQLLLQSNMQYRCGRCLHLPDSGFNVLTPVSGAQQTVWTFQRLPESVQHLSAQQVAEVSPGNYIVLTRFGELLDLQHPARYSNIRKVLSTNHIRCSGIVAVSPDGDLLEIHEADTARTSVLDLAADVVLSGSAFGQRPATLDTIELQRSLKAIHIRIPHFRFRLVGTDGRQLVLRGVRGATFRIEHISVLRTLGMVAVANGTSAVSMMEFHDLPSVRDSRCLVCMATWPGGGRAWLDARGLLHLKSSDPAVREVCLTLRDGSLAGWTSAGELFGDEYYTGGLGSDQPADLKLISVADAWLTRIVPLLESLS